MPTAQGDKLLPGAFARVHQLPLVPPAFLGEDMSGQRNLPSYEKIHSFDKDFEVPHNKD